MSLNLLPRQCRSTKSRLTLLLMVPLCFAAALPLLVRAGLQSSATRESQQKQKRSEFIPGEILVRFRKDAAATKVARAEMTVVEDGRQIPLQVERLDGPEIVEGLRLARVAPEDTMQAIKALRFRPDVLYAEPNYIRRKDTAPNDPRYSEQWALKNSGQSGGTVGADIKAEQAWDITTGSRNIVVGVVDEGIDINHPDLKDNIWKNPGEIPDNGVDDDGNGYVDDVNGWDFLNNDNTVFDGNGTYPTDQTDAHGTHVAGTIGATGNNGVGVVGVNWQVSLMSLKFLGVDGGSTAKLLQAFSYAKTMRDLWSTSGGSKGANLRILNNSYGGPGFSQAELDAINALGQSGILFVAAAGNDGTSNDHYLNFPACYKAPNVISVASTDHYDHPSSFSNYGLSVDLGAPGEDILSTTPNSTYSVFSGTSMAAPHATGAAALISAVNPSITLERLRGAILLSGDLLEGNVSTTKTQRRLNVSSALQSAGASDAQPPAAISDLRVLSQSGTGLYLQWTAPGDDANVGRAALYEVRFTDSYPQTSEQFEFGTEKWAPPPATSGTQELVQLNVPFQHPNGFLSVRAVDKVGNKGPIASVQVSVDVDIADPYTITESSSTTLSTGGTPLGLKGDDKITQVIMPFPFKYYGEFATYLYVSTNGAIYLPISPYYVNPPIVPDGTGQGTDAANSIPALGGLSMIAGLWDDLRTDRHPSDEVYMVQPDPRRVIFRWQAVTYDQAIDGTRRGENAVNFEIELRSDGQIFLRYGSGNLNVFPIVGVSAGGPDAYVITSHSSASITNLTNASTVALQRRRPPSNDLGLSMSGMPDYAGPGQQINYTIRVDTFGPDPAEKIVVTDPLPPGTTFVSCVVPRGNCSGPPVGANGTVIANLDYVNAGEQASITIAARVVATPGATLVNSASVYGLFQDLNLANNTASFTVNVVQDDGLQGIRAISAGEFINVALRLDGTVVAWGENSNSGLGDGSTTEQLRPVQVVGLDRIITVSTGSGFLLALREDGTVWQTGVSTATINSPIPVQVNGISSVKAISAGGGHCLAVKTDGTVWSWGANDFGQLGTGQVSIFPSPPGQVPGLANILSVRGGTGHSLALGADGTVWAWGRNQEGEVGDGTDLNNRPSPIHINGLDGVIALAAGAEHSMALRSDGSVWVWGRNGNGQLASPVFNFIQKTPVPVSAISNVSAIEAGTFHSLAVKSDGTAWAWGRNDAGQLGDGTTEQRTSPTRVTGLNGVSGIAGGLIHSAALLSNGSVQTWGRNDHGELGDGTTVNRLTAGVVSGFPQVSSPGFDRYGGDFTSPQDVAISCYTPGAVIHYAVNGSDPTEADPSINSGSTIRLLTSTTLKARAWKPGLIPSQTASITFTIRIVPNPIDDVRTFVRQQYLDFLSREPDQEGWDYWTDQINSCGADQLCINARRIPVSDAFFFEPEFQQTGSYVFRLYRAAYGDSQPFPNPDADPRVPGLNLTIPNHAVFNQDRAQVVGGTGLAQSQLDLANAFVQRPGFLNKYPAGQSAQEFINAVLATIQSADTRVDLSSQQSALMTLYNQGGRGAVMYRLADDNVQTNIINNRGFIDAEYNRTFVTVEYFGYLRRDADTFGLNFWLGQLNRFALRDINIQHAMVCSFITSIEYQQRFGSAVTHTNQECPQ